MATLNKHGELGQLDKLQYKACYCADGQILRREGTGGWKTWKKLKPGIDPREHYQKAVEKYQAKLQQPGFSAWRAAVHEFPFSARWMIVETVRVMPDDPDGVYSELNDHAAMTGGLDYEQAARLCSTYKLACEEAKANLIPD